MKLVLYALILVACSTASAAEPVTVLDLPLGGKLKTPLKQCPPFRLNAEVPAVCWKGSPHAFNKTRLGEIGVPGEARRPKWAAYSEFSAWIQNDGTLRSFDVRTLDSDKFVEIVNSISGRFGQSKRESPPGSRIMSAEWDLKDIHIYMLCSKDIGCKTTFTSAAARADHLKELASRAAKDAARPASPR